MSNTEFIPFAKPSIGQEEIDAVVECLRSGWLTTGGVTQQFEREFAEYVGAKHAIAVNSATAGLHLALESQDIGPGQRVITTPYTFTASAEVIRYLGADPLFVDIDAESMNISPANIETALQSGDDIAALLPVHFAGQACDMTEFRRLSEKYSVPVVEDAAHALPCTFGGERVGSIGDITVFSFYATKTLATGEGGMVTTDDDEAAARIRRMRLHGIDRDVFNRYSSEKPAWYYEVVAPGFKYNMTDIAAAIGREQLKKIENFRDRRELIAHRYAECFEGLPVACPKQLVAADTHAWHLFVLQLKLEDLKIGRDDFISKLSEKGVGASVHFIPLHLQPYWRDRFSFAETDFPVALDVYRRAVSLPIYPGMSDDDVNRVISVVRETLVHNTK
jgi:dTDP-4-amino-4,6-dideoxygalactose transaminase